MKLVSVGMVNTWWVLAAAVIPAANACSLISVGTLFIIVGNYLELGDSSSSKEIGKRSRELVFIIVGNCLELGDSSSSEEMGKRSRELMFIIVGNYLELSRIS